MTLLHELSVGEVVKIDAVVTRQVSLSATEIALLPSDDGGDQMSAECVTLASNFAVDVYAE